MAPFVPSIDRIARDAGTTPEVTRAAATSALRALHRVAVTNPTNVTEAIAQAHFLFGQEACFHLTGLLEVSRTETDPDIPWSETLNRFAPRLRHYNRLVERWLRDDCDNGEESG